jgi:hypothetical protein
VKEDVVKIFSWMGQAEKTKEIMESVLSFDFYRLLKNSKINHLKNDLYQGISKECPYFLNAFRLVKYQGKAPDSLKENERINQKMDLIDIFFDIKLPF